MKAQYVTCCVDSTAEKIDDMVYNAREITCQTFLRNADIDVEAFGYVKSGRGLRLKSDWAVSFFKSKFCGKPCYYMAHSCIEYIYC